MLDLRQIIVWFPDIFITNSVKLILSYHFHAVTGPTLLPGSLSFLFLEARVREGKKKDPGNKVVTGPGEAPQGVP